MKIISETSLRGFQFWCGAKDNAANLTDEQLDEVESILEQTEPEDGWTDTAINDLFWFEFDTIRDWLSLDENCRKIGSVEWAENILHHHVDQNEASIQLGNPESVIKSYLDEEYDESNFPTEDVLKYDFDEYVLRKWQDMVVEQLHAWHQEKDVEDIRYWVEDNYYDKEDIPDWEGVVDEYDEYLKTNKEQE